ncbi:MOSC domain-containing protein [Arenimonas aestuarii]
MASLSAIHVYPVKSCAGQSVETAVVQPRGLEHDRRWMLVDADGKFITARQEPRLLQVQPVTTDEGLTLEAPGMPRLAVAAPRGGATLSVTVWKDHVEARAVDPATDGWFSRYLGRPVRLVHMDEGVIRRNVSSRAQPGDEVSFADSMPLLLVSRAALDALNERLDRPVPMARFRPNLVVDGVDAHAEDAWKQVTIGDVVFDVAKPCTRCVLVTIDADTGRRDEGGEPLRTLTRYRRGEDGVLFGQLLVPRTRGQVSTGDPIRGSG